MTKQEHFPEAMSVDAVAARLGVSPWTLRTWIRLGKVAHFRIGRRVLLRVDDIRSLMNETYKPATRPA